jgi:hypothetical protein
VLVDGVSSQRLGDRSVALQRLAQSGAFLATSGVGLCPCCRNRSQCLQACRGTCC